MYSTVAAFLLLKGWKKPRAPGEPRKNGSDKSKKAFEELAMELRRKISMAKAELERLRENGKLTKKGKRNRALLLRECKVISAAELVSYMEKKKSQLRKLRTQRIREVRNEEARSLNQQFTQNTKQVYAKFAAMCEDDVERPRYRVVDKDGHHGNGECFDDIEAASSFWRSLWESSGTGNKDANWMKDIKEAIASRVPPPSEEKWDLDPTIAAKIMRKKRNFSAPGLVNFWWKRATSLHNEVTQAFMAISKIDGEYPQWFAEGKTSLLPKPGEFSSENQRPITCLNDLYKWFTSCVQGPMDDHLGEHELMENEQRGAKEGSSGTTDNLLIDIKDRNT